MFPKITASALLITIALCYLVFFFLVLQHHRNATYWPECIILGGKATYKKVTKSYLTKLAANRINYFVWTRLCEKWDNVCKKRRVVLDIHLIWRRTKSLLSHLWLCKQSRWVILSWANTLQTWARGTVKSISIVQNLYRLFRINIYIYLITIRISRYELITKLIEELVGRYETNRKV